MHCIGSTFQHRAQAHGDRVALVSGDERVSYGELNGRANRLAHYLHARGVGPGSRVGLHLGRSSELIVAMLAVLKAGGAYVPLDPEYPSERLLYMLEDAGVGVLVSDEQGLSGLPGFELGLVEVVSVDGEAGEIAAETETDPAWRVGGEELAYVMYTSGSTGQPKGVAIAHRGLINLAEQQIEHFRVNADSRVVQFASACFDASVSETLMALLSGGRLFLVDTSLLRSPSEFCALMRDEGINVATLPPSYLATLHPQELPDLESLVVAGEVCPPAVAERWQEQCRLFNAYGPTEASVCATIHRCEGPVGERVSIGRAIGNVQVHLLDEAMHSLSPGATGELYIGGVGIAWGYWGRSRLTAERFVPDPTGTNPGMRLYRTGDRARLLADGQLEFIGRTDEQVKLRGYRIEPGEVEAALMQHPQVRNAAVVARQGDGLVAFLTSERGAEFSSSFVFDALHATLPHFMIPNRLELMNELPLLLNGKIDREALCTIHLMQDRDVGHGISLPRNQNEETLVEAFRVALNQQVVNVTDDFFELGGDSISGITLIAEAERRGISISLEELFLHRTVETIALHSVPTDVEREVHAVRPIGPFELVDVAVREAMADGIEDAYPLSRMQAGMLFHYESRPSAGVYHDIMNFRLHGVLNVEALQRALNEVVARCPVLRTSFDLAAQPEALQLVHRDVAVPLVVADWRSMTAEQQHESLERWNREEIRRGIDVSRAPVLRMYVHWLTDEEFELTISCTHAILDGWSASVVMVMLLKHYHSLLSGNGGLPQAPQPLAFRDYIAMERETLADEGEREFWCEQLEDAQLSQLPRFRQPRRIGETGRVVLELADFDVAAVGAMSRAAKVSIKAVFLALHLKVLSVLTGRADVMTGLLTNGRPEAEGGDQLVGLFLNTVPLHFRFGLGKSWLELFVEIFEADRRCWAHRRYPLAQIMADQGRGQLFDTAFNFTHLPLYDHSGGSARLLSLRRWEYAEFPLVFQCGLSPDGGELHAVLEFDTAVFDRAEMERAARVYETVLQAFSTDLGDVHDRRSNVSKDTYDHAPLPRAYPRELAVHELFAEVALAHGDRVALVSGDERVSYGELNGRANRLAHYLHARGVGPGSRVGLHLGRSSELIVAMLAVLKAGGAYVPLDPEYPSERLLYMLEDAGVGVLVSDEQGLSGLPGFELGLVEVVSVDGEAGEIAAETETDPAWRVGGEELAYVMYTSGSTGQPKGVAIAHRGLINLAEQQIEHFRVNADSRVVQFASACFDASVWETLMALLSGGRLFLVDTRLLRSPSEFCALMRDEGINVATLPPSYLATLHPQELPDLESLVVAGEVCPPAVAERWQEQCRLFNAYGPTEASVCATIHRCEGPVGERVSIGRAIGNVQVHLLDEAMHSLSPGATGELYIGGVGIAWGYWGRSRLTAERFVPDPTGTNPGMRLYRTGDRARLLADGQLEFIGRTDEQVKLRGYRIEPGEVEAALMQHPQVRNAAVVAQEGQEHSILAAYVVWENDVTPSHSKLASYLRERLPPHMVPAVYANVARMPLTRAGKIDRSQLAVRTTTALDDEEYVAPRTELEKQLAALWAEVLGHGHVGIRDNFFDLGGDSLLSIRLKARAEKAGLSFEIEDLFVLQTIEKLTPFASRISNRPNQDWLRPIGPFELVDMAVREAMADGIEDAYPLSRMQAGMLFHYESRPSAGVYHDIMNFRLHGVLNVEALQRALNEVVARCPVLRTSFDLAAQPEALQLVHRDVAVPLVVADWRSMTAEQQHESLERWNREEIRRGIDVSRAPVLRMYVHWLTDEEFELTISCTHAILDGWSASVVMVMLLKHYHSLLSGNGGLPQAPQPLAFRDYIAMERETLADEGEREFWCEQLEDAQLSQLPRFRQPRRIGETGRVVLELADFDVAAVGAMSRAAKVSIKAVFLALHLKVLSVLTGRADVMTGLLTNGRPEAEGGDQLVGLFLNTVPLHFRFGLGKSWLELFVEIFEAERRCWAHRRYPLAQIMADQGRGQLFDTAFNFTRFHEYEELNACESVSISNKGGFEYSNFPLVFQCGLSPDGGELHAVLEFDTAVFDRAEMERAARVYETVLQAFSTDLGDVHDRRSNVSKDTYDHAPLPRAYPRELAVHELFAEVALAHGDRVALVSGDERVSYGELNGRANRLAHYLHARGVGPGSRVGLHLGRSSELIVAMLAVLKAGGAYVPLDPEYPSERLLYMLEDAGVGVLVSDEQGLSGLPGFELGLVEVVSVDGEAGEIAAETETDPAWRVGGEELAYVMYTSGSTGQPKGVAVPHRAIVRLISDSDYCPVRESDCVAQASNACFDAMTFEVYAALTNGARLQLLSKEVMLSPPHLHQELQRGGVTILFVTTALFNQYAMSDTRPLRGLRQVLFGGQQANPRCVAQALARGGARRLLHVYGPTEATTFSTWHQVEELEPDADTVPIGRSLSNGRSYVLDEALHPVPLGTPGELYLGGDGVAHGYWCRSRLTAECFVPDPYAGVSGARMYRTGDRVRQRCDGALEFIGRTDDQVKVRGFRVEPGEVEAALLQHPAVRMAAVVADQAMADTDARLRAFVVLAREREDQSNEGTLRAYLQLRLPAFAVPARIEPVDTLPITSTGKIDRRALTGRRHTVTQAARSCIGGDTAEKIREMWAQVLALDTIVDTAEFFALGGDSLSAMRVTALVRAEFAVELNVGLIYEHSRFIDFWVAVLRLRILHAVEEDALVRFVEELPEECADELLRETSMSEPITSQSWQNHEHV